jgi:hypothetical protein
MKQKIKNKKRESKKYNLSETSKLQKELNSSQEILCIKKKHYFHIFIV